MPNVSVEQINDTLDEYEERVNTEPVTLNEAFEIAIALEGDASDAIYMELLSTIKEAIYQSDQTYLLNRISQIGKDMQTHVERLIDAARRFSKDPGLVRKAYNLKDNHHHRLSELDRHRGTNANFHPVSLNHSIMQAVELTQPKWQAKTERNGITIAIGTHLQQVPLVMGNEAALREALIHLIFNAVDAISRSGSIILCTWADNKNTALEVSDTGAGMTEEVRKRCLDPFFTTKDERGAGLGWVKLLDIIQRHEGTIDIESEPGMGTTFRICLPILKRASLSESRGG